MPNHSVKNANEGDILYEVINLHHIREMTFNPRRKADMRSLKAGRLFKRRIYAEQLCHSMLDRNRREYDELCRRIDASIAP
ncbi:hypothetical protein C0J08_15170 [Marinomonas sp. CT5]|uniref:hypothetical protein n=1 Tax=Marinomonas sp. CT5 TaxID=2066133 RepID=UPI001BB041DB|nr:hypothetical protein [Marinomonas sp. CT5]QUX96656.1 hypothetical protein C0J08_15170 [Marinomonas sp. CT5]